MISPEWRDKWVGGRSQPDLHDDAKKATIDAIYASLLVCRPIARLSPSCAWAVAAPARRISAWARDCAADGAPGRHVDSGVEASRRRGTSHAREARQSDGVP